MHFPGFNVLPPLRLITLGLLGLFWILSATSLETIAQTPPQPLSERALDLPEQLGRVVYQTQTAATSRVYIIANGHRSALTAAGTEETLQAQIETFRIGEWLINQNRIDLLLPEGFFGKMRKTAPTEGLKMLNHQRLQEALADPSLFVNAELLLHKNYGIGLDQVEDRKLYRQTREQLRSSLTPEASLSPSLIQELDYLQQLRTASILQTTPEVIAAAYRQGRIAAPHAMLTIGLSHLEDIINFLQQGEISMPALHTETRDFPAQTTPLEFLKQRLNVTVIVPRSLSSRLNRG